VFVRIVFRVVDPKNERDVLAFGGRRDDDFPSAAAVDVRARLRRVGEQTGRLNDEFDPEVPPRKFTRIAFGEDFDRASVDANAVVRCDALALEGSVVRIVFEEVRALRRARQIIDGRDLDPRMALE
jgi:hypothetical protein